MRTPAIAANHTLRAERIAAERRATALPLPLGIGLGVTAAAILGGWLLLAGLHLSDDYGMNHTHGVWIAAADSARQGRLYPPLFDGEHYAGTRYMPVPILLNAAAVAIVGNPLAGGKLLAALLMAALLVVVLVISRRSSCPWPLALALAAVIPATRVGLSAATTIGGDLIATLLQLAAIAVALHDSRRGSMMAAGILAGLGAAAKLTGVWGALAVLTWLTIDRRWRPAGWFGIAFFLTSAIMLGTIQLLTDGRFSQHLFVFSAAGVDRALSIVRAPNQLLYQLTNHAFGAIVLVPLAIVAAVFWTPRHQPLVHLAFGYATLLLLVVYADVGTGFNQLLDLIVLTVVSVGLLAGRAAAAQDAAGRAILTVLSVCVLWAAGLDLVRTIAFEVRQSVAAARAATTSRPAVEVIGERIRPEDVLLTADPWVDVALDRRPVVMDAFMLGRLDRSRPEWVDPLIDRINRRQFGLVVLTMPLEDAESGSWWRDYHFGPRLAEALRSNYRPDGTIGRYYLYRPAVDP